MTGALRSPAWWCRKAVRRRLTGMQTDLDVAPGVTSSRIELGLRALAWGFLSFIGFIATLSSLAWPIGRLQEAGVDHAATLGLWALAWVPASGLVALLAARIAFGVWLHVRTLAWLVLLAGALMSGAHLWVLADWAIARYGASDPDYVGSTFLLFAVVAGVAVAAFGVQVAPRWAAWSPLLAVAGGVGIGVGILLTNVPGMGDGLAVDSRPLALVTVAAALYVGAVGLVSIARLRRG